MRFDTSANRVRYGLPSFVTFSHDEARGLWIGAHVESAPKGPLGEGSRCDRHPLLWHQELRPRLEAFKGRLYGLCSSQVLV